MKEICIFNEETYDASEPKPNEDNDITTLTEIQDDVNDFIKNVIEDSGGKVINIFTESGTNGRLRIILYYDLTN